PSLILPRPLAWYAVTLCVTSVLASSVTTKAQTPDIRHGGTMPHEVREIYERGLQFLAGSQGEDGAWPTTAENGPGITGLCLMAFLASGEDPNFGQYSRNVHAAVRSIIAGQDPATGIIGGGTGRGNMYHHGFAMLALAEAYGTVDDRRL